MDGKASWSAADKKSGGDDNDNKNATKRVTVIRRQIDPNRLNNSGLNLQIAQVLHQKKLEKAQQQQQLPEQNTTKTQKEEKQMTTTSTAPVTTGIADISSEQVDQKSSQKLSAFQSIPKVLSVPKITITSPPCENSTETLRENRYNRLEDVKRLLNRQILMRKRANNTTDINTVPLSSRKQEPKTTVTLQLPPQTSIKSYRKSEVPISTSVTTTTSPVITVRKFHTLASESLFIKEIPTTTLSTQVSQVPPHSMVNTSVGTTIRPVTVSSTGGLTLSNIVNQRTNVVPMSVSTTNSVQPQPQVSHTGLRQTLSTAVLATKAIIRPITVSSAEIPIQASRPVTVKPITTLSTSTPHLIQSQQIRQDICSNSTSQKPLKSVNMQRKVSLTKSSTALSSDSASTKKLPLNQSNPRYIIGPTISTPKPKILEIFTSTPLGQTEAEEITVKKPNIIKPTYETTILTAPASKEAQHAHASDIASLPSKATDSINKAKTVKSYGSDDLEGSDNNTTDKMMSKYAIRSELKQANRPMDETKNTDSRLSQTQNVPIVLENKLLKPGEHIDLKGLRLACQNYDDGQSKTTEMIPKKQEVSLSQTTPSNQSTLSSQVGKTKRKMHVIISNEKLKSAKSDMAALAKKVLQRASISSPGSGENPKVSLKALPNKSGIESSALSSDGETNLKTPLTKSIESLVVQSTATKSKPEILKASMSIVKKDLTQASHQKAALRKKVLAFCGIRDDEQVSPLREYPKTVEIVEDEEATDDDTSAPTAVDFIASLALQNCSFSATDNSIQEEKNTDAGHLNISLSNDELNTTIEDKILEIQTEKFPKKSDNKITKNQKSSPVEEIRKEIIPKPQQVKLFDDMSLEVKSVVFERSINPLNTEDLKTSQSNEITSKGLQKELGEHIPSDRGVLTLNHQLDEKITHQNANTDKTLQKDLIENISLDSDAVTLEQDNNLLGANKIQVNSSGESSVSLFNETNKIKLLEGRDTAPNDSSRSLKNDCESVKSFDNKNAEALNTPTTPITTAKDICKDENEILENLVVDESRVDDGAHLSKQTKKIDLKEIDNLKNDVLPCETKQNKINDATTTEKHSSSSLNNLDLKDSSHTSDLPKETMRKRIRFRKAQVNLTARKKPKTNTDQVSTNKIIDIVATAPHEKNDTITEDKASEILKKSISEVNDEEKLQTDPESDQIELYPTVSKPEILKSSLNACQNTETIVNVITQNANECESTLLIVPEKLKIAKDHMPTASLEFKKSITPSVSAEVESTKDHKSDVSFKAQKLIQSSPEEMGSTKDHMSDVSLVAKNPILTVPEEIEIPKDHTPYVSREAKKPILLSVLKDPEGAKDHMPDVSLEAKKSVLSVSEEMESPKDHMSDVFLEAEKPILLSISQVLEGAKDHVSDVSLESKNSEEENSTKDNVSHVFLDPSFPIERVPQGQNVPGNETDSNCRRNSLNSEVDAQITDCDPIISTENKELLPKTCEVLKEHSSTSGYIISLNLESDKEEIETERHEGTLQKKLDQECKESGIKILASVPISDEGVVFPDVVKAESSIQTPLPEVGTIIDMKAYGLEKSNADIIVQQVVLENLNNTKSKEDSPKCSENSELQSEIQKPAITNMNSETSIQESILSKPINCMDDNDSDILSCVADNNDNSDTDTNVPITSRKRLRRKRPITSLLSTSGSEHETDEEEIPLSSRPGRISAIKNLEGSSTSASSELFGFSAKTIRTIEKGKTDYEGPNADLVEEHNLDLLSPKSTGKDTESMFTSPFVAVDIRRNVPLKKRWELSQQHSHDETDITDDTSPAADDDTMDDEGNENKYQEMDENVNSVSSLDAIPVQISSTILISTEERKETVSDEQKDEMKEDAACNVQSPSMENVLTNSQSGTSEQSLSTKTDDAKTSSCAATIELLTKQTPEISDKDEKSAVASSLKRGRKPKASITERTTGESEEDFQPSDESRTSLTPLPRRRGRPPKKVQRQEVSTPSNLVDTTAEPSTSKAGDLTSLEQKKRGRKPRLEIKATNLDGAISHETDSAKPNQESVSLEETNLLSENRDQQQDQCDTSCLEITKTPLPNIPNDEVAGLNPKSCQMVEDDVPLKKKRGRKPRASLDVSLPSPIDESTPKLIQENHNVPKELETVGKKKRGRKPRQQILEQAEETGDIDIPQETPNVSKDLETPLKKKRGRKPREIVSSSFAESPQAEVNTPLPRKRRRKSRESITNETADAVEVTTNLDTTQFNPEPSTAMKTTPRQITKKRQVNTGDFNPRLLLIRQREQLDTDEVLTVPESEAGEGPLQCGLCLARVKPSNWTSHLAEHYGIGWIVGKEPAVDITTRSIVLSKMMAYFKQHGTPLLCRICQRSYRSSLGLLLHFESCGEVQSRVQCPICKNDYTKLSYLNHQRSCQLTKNDDDEKQSTTTEPVINSSGRLKRKSLMKAETKLKKLTKELSEVEAAFEPKDFIQYRENSAEDQDGKGCYHCTVCPVIPGTSFPDEAGAVNHVMEKHRTERKADKDFGSDTSDFGENSAVAEEGEESDGMSTSTDVSAADSSDEEKATKSRATKKKSSGKKKNATESKRTGALPAVYSARNYDVPKLVLSKWKQFIGANYSEDTLYTFAKPIYSEEKNRALEMLSSEIDSMKFTYSQSANLFKVLGKPKALEWQKLQRFQSVDQSRSDKLICLGAPIKTLAWAPLPKQVAEQYLVVSCRKDLFTFTRVRNPKREEAHLFVYKITTTQDGSQEKKKSFSATIHYALSVPNGPVHTVAFLPSGGYDLTTNRLGLLAVGSASSEIKIYTLPIEPTQCHELKIESIAQTVRVVSLKPTIELILNVNNNGSLNGHCLIATQCLHICWSEFTGHRHIFASYANGFIGFWDIEEPENPLYNLNCSIRDGIRCFLPLNYFYFDEKAVKAFAIHYDTNGPRWLAAQGCARKLIIYDIHDMANPMPFKEELLRNIPRDMYWSPIWETFTTAFCDTMPNNGRTIIAFNPAAISFSHSRMEYMLCGVSTLHYSPWQNVYGIGVDNGDIVYINTREMNHDLNVLIRSKNNTIALSVLDIKRLDGGELIRPKSSDNRENWNMYEKDYKEKYGIVFGQINKFTAADRTVYLNDKRIPPRNLERFMRISVLRWNLNVLGKRYIAIGYENGFLRIMQFKRESYFN